MEVVRRALLERGSVSAGTNWAASWREDLRKQGRPAAGGWPGTLSEARAHVTSFFLRELRQRSMLALTPEEREWTAKAAYAAARQDWLSHGEHEEEDP
jgi:hypothetical protein